MDPQITLLQECKTHTLVCQCCSQTPIKEVFKCLSSRITLESM